MRSDLYKPNLDNLTTAQLLSLARQLGVPCESAFALEYGFDDDDHGSEHRSSEHRSDVNFEILDDEDDE